jgi:heme-degrading monooxygenase HmoA
MYIALNRFQILPGKEMHFEKIWRGRDSKLANVLGFKTFNLIQGDSTGDYTLYASHTTWHSKNDFVAWTKSESFREAHKNAGSRNNIFSGRLIFEGFEIIL